MPLILDLVMRIAAPQALLVRFCSLYRWGTFFLAAGGLLAFPGRPCLARAPNIVLIVSDDQGYNDLGVLDEEVQTPALDRLARTGVRLTNFYVSWPACTPSRSGFLTGRYPQRNGVYDMIRNEAPDYGHKYTPEEYLATFERVAGMDEREILLPQMLKPAGYACGIFGKWDLGVSRRFLPLQRGFDAFYGFTNTGIDYFTHERYGVPSMYSGNDPTIKDKGIYCTELFRREALRFLQQHQGQPFFLYLPFNAPHNASNLDPAIRGAAQAPQKYKDRFPHLKDDFREVERRGETVKVPTLSRRRLEYLASIACMDEAIGDIMQMIEEAGQAENTLYIFFSDNGGAGGGNNKPLRGGKGQMFEGGVRVCALVSGLDLPANRVCDEFLTSLDLVPTLLQLAAAAPPDGLILDGDDVWPALQGLESAKRQKMFWQRRADKAARVGQWKWVHQGGESYLFNLAGDPGEKKNLIDMLPDRAREMEAHFAAWQAEMETAEPRGPFRDY